MVTCEVLGLTKQWISLSQVEEGETFVAHMAHHIGKGAKLNKNDLDKLKERTKVMFASGVNVVVHRHSDDASVEYVRVRIDEHVKVRGSKKKTKAAAR